MARDEEIRRATELLSIWFSKIKLNSAIGFYDINKTAENVCLVLLKNLYGYEQIMHLSNNVRFPSIDLSDKQKKIGIQVTSRTDSLKISDSIQKFLKHNLDKEYNTLKFVILNFDKIKLPDNFPNEFGRILLTSDSYHKIIDKKNLAKFKSNTIGKNVIPIETLFPLLIERLNKEYISESEFFDELETDFKNLESNSSLIKNSLIHYKDYIRDYLSKKVIFNRSEDIISYSEIINKLTELQNINRPKFILVLNELEHNLIYSNKSDFFFFTDEVQNALRDTDKELIQKIENKIVPELINGMRETFLKYGKTFLNSEPQNFYSYYFPLSIRLGTETYKKVDSLSIFGDHNNNSIDYLTIIGGAGTGKSTLVKHLFLSCIEKYVGIPILVEFRTFNDYNGSLIDYITSVPLKSGRFKN